MMYRAPFFITGPGGNNSFGQPAREGRSLYVPRLISGSIEDVSIGDGVAFEEIGTNGEIMSFYGLKDFIGTDFRGVPAYIFDNHNHAFYFWNLAKKNGMIEEPATLIHIDEHSDMREPEAYLEKDEISDIRKIFEYTNRVLNVGNYIMPAIRSGLVGEIFNIQSESQLDDLPSVIGKIRGDIILNLDLDFFSEGMEYIDYDKKRSIILDVAEKSRLITISTSPFFIDAEKAIRICKDIFR